MTQAQFDLKNYLSKNRDFVIEKYSELEKEPFFSGISLRDFMLRIMNRMSENNISTEKRANLMFNRLVYDVYNDNVRIGVINNRDAALSEKYKGTAYMALV